MSLVFHNIDPPPPSPPAECVPPPPPPLVRGEDTLAGWRKGWGVKFWKTRDTALYSTYVSTLWVQRCTAVCEEQQKRFRGIYHVKRTTVEAEFLDEIQTKAEFSSLLF
jgi:hypothetical protein